MKLAVPFACVVLAAVLIAVAYRSDAKPQSSLADRVNDACPAGYLVSDWSTTDEDYLPLGDTVMVECSTVKQNEYGLPVRVIHVAVQR